MFLNIDGVLKLDHNLILLLCLFYVIAMLKKSQFNANSDKRLYFIKNNSLTFYNSIIISIFIY